MAADPVILKDHLKSHGELIWNFAHGRDVSIVESERPDNKGYENSVTVPFDVKDANTAKLVLLALAEKVAARLRKDHVKAEVTVIGIKLYDFSYTGHQLTLNNATNITLEIYKFACQLFDELWNGAVIRHLGIHAGRIRDNINMWQIDMFDSTIDSIRNRYGNDSIKRLAFICLAGSAKTSIR